MNKKPSYTPIWKLEGEDRLAAIRSYMFGGKYFMKEVYMEDKGDQWGFLVVSRHENPRYLHWWKVGGSEGVDNMAKNLVNVTGYVPKAFRDSMDPAELDDKAWAALEQMRLEGSIPGGAIFPK